jgi:integrase
MRQPNGRPKVYRGADGWYHSYVTVGRKPDGTPDRRHVKRRTATEVSVEVDRLLERVRRGGGAPPAKIQTVADWLRHWLEHIVRPNRSANTWRAYRSLIVTHVEPAIGHRRLDGSRNVLEPEHVEAMYTAMASTLEPSSVLKTHRILSRALKVAARRGKAARNVCDLIDAPTARRKRMESYDLDDAQKLLAAAAGDPLEARWLVGLLLGPRQGEALGLRWPRVHLDTVPPIIQIAKQLQRHNWRHGCDDPPACAARKCRTKPCRPAWAHGCGSAPECSGKQGRTCPQREPGPCRRHRVAANCARMCRLGCTGHAKACPQKISGGLVEVDVKSERGDRDIPLPPVVVAALEQRRQDQMREAHARSARWDHTGLVFTRPDGHPVDPRDDHDAWKALARKAGVPARRLHAARHTALSLLVATGTDITVVQELAGHADIRTTGGYVDVAAEQKRKAVERAAAALMDGGLMALLQPNPATSGAGK